MNYLTKSLPLLSFLLSAIVAWLLIPITSGFPMVPFVIFFVGLSTLVYLIRETHSWFETVLYLGILALSSSLMFRADEIILFIDLVFIFSFGSLLILPLEHGQSLLNLFLTPAAAIYETLTGENRFPYSFRFLKRFKRADQIQKYLPSVLVTFLFLSVTIPLLMSANPFFNQLVQNTIKFFDLTEFVRFFSEQQLFIDTIRLVMLVFFTYSIPRALTVSRKGVTRKELHVSLPVNYLIPKVAMGALLIVFFITQAQLFFASPDVLRSLGYTNSRLTNEVFFQVTFVAFIIFFLAYLDKGRKTWNKTLTYFLILEAFFLIGIAFKSVIDYSTLWGLTQKRLWGYATMMWLSGALALFLNHYKKQTTSLHFFHQVITFTILVLMGINIVNFDYLIAHFSKAKTQNGTDYVYLAKLSADSRSYSDTLTHLMSQIDSSNTLERDKVLAAYSLLGKIDSLKQKYQERDQSNSFNFSEYQEYRNVRTLNTDGYRKRLIKIEQRYQRN